jgi:hypothetical protein
MTLHDGPLETIYGWFTFGRASLRDPPIGRKVRIRVKRIGGTRKARSTLQFSPDAEICYDTKTRCQRFAAERQPVRDVFEWTPAMPIEFECGCGKKLTAKEEFVGRRLRCPGCQSVLTIPKSSLMATPVVPPRGSEHGMDVLKAATAAMAGKQQPLPPVAGPKTAASMFIDEPMPGSKTAKPRAGDSTTPVATPLAAPISLPGTPVVPEPKHPWIDESFEQTSVPFRDDDDIRFPSRGPDRDWGTIVGLVGSVAIVALGVLLVK